MGPNNDLCQVYCVFRSFLLKNFNTNFLGTGNFLKKTFFGKRCGHGRHNPKKELIILFLLFLDNFCDLSEKKISKIWPIIGKKIALLRSFEFHRTCPNIAHQFLFLLTKFWDIGRPRRLLKCSYQYKWIYTQCCKANFKIQKSVTRFFCHC